MTLKHHGLSNFELLYGGKEVCSQKGINYGAI
jgi:hypothetical protein